MHDCDDPIETCLKEDKRQPGKIVMRNRVSLYNITIVAEILDSPGFLEFRVAWAFDSSDPCKYGGCQYSFGWGNSRNPLS
jgi:hypothetical protein